MQVDADRVYPLSARGNPFAIDNFSDLDKMGIETEVAWINNVKWLFVCRSQHDDKMGIDTEHGSTEIINI